jgi:hypothetical protein
VLTPQLPRLFCTLQVPTPGWVGSLSIRLGEDKVLCCAAYIGDYCIDYRWTSRLVCSARGLAGRYLALLAARKYTFATV